MSQSSQATTPALIEYDPRQHPDKKVVALSQSRPPIPLPELKEFDSSQLSDKTFVVTLTPRRAGISWHTRRETKSTPEMKDADQSLSPEEEERAKQDLLEKVRRYEQEFYAEQRLPDRLEQILQEENKRCEQKSTATIITPTSRKTISMKEFNAMDQSKLPRDSVVLMLAPRRKGKVWALQKLMHDLKIKSPFANLDR